MSHYTVIVCLDDPNHLAEALAPFDENTEVEPYRDYEDGEAHEYWLYSSLRRADEDDRNGTGIKPYKPNELGWSSASSKDTPEVQRQKIAEDAAQFRALPNPVSWSDIVRLHNERYPDDANPMYYDADSGRAYQMSTYNPDSKWDWYQVGGRWKGYFRHLSGADVIHGQSGAFGSSISETSLRCDGGRKSVLDLKGMREEKAAEARETYARWLKVVDGTPEARPWSEFAEVIDKLDDYTIDQARLEYGSQPRVQALKGTDFNVFECAIEMYQKPERLFVEIERARAVPGYAVLTLDGKWMAPGRMGWWGVSSDSDSDRAGYWEVANAYLDSLDDSTWLVLVDCHI